MTAPSETLAARIARLRDASTPKGGGGGGGGIAISAIGGGVTPADEPLDIIAELEARLAMAREGLRFYAADAIYRFRTEPYWSASTPPRLIYPLGYPDAKVLNDGGEAARKALAATDLSVPFEGEG